MPLPQRASNRPILGREGEGSALVVIPESVNAFNNIAGRRLAEALEGLGWNAQVVSLRDYETGGADVVFLVSLHELIVSCGDDLLASEKLERLKRSCGLTVMWLLEPTRTHWFDISYERFTEYGVDLLMDNAIHDQSATLEDDQRSVYRYLFYGLTESEKRRVREGRFEDDRRTIPWAYIGLKTRLRSLLGQYLVDEVDPAGFLYLTDHLPYTEDGPGLKDERFQDVLSRTRYQIWRSQGSYFYMEGERYRRSVLAGCVPLKVLVEDAPEGENLPFANLLVSQKDLVSAMNPDTFKATRDAFVAEYLSLPSLEDELRRTLQDLGMPVSNASVAREVLA